MSSVICVVGCGLAAITVAGCGSDPAQASQEAQPPAPIEDGPACHPPPSPPPSRVGEAAGFEYHERVYGHADPDMALPMLVSLHGMGDQPRAPFDQFDLPIRVISPRAPHTYGEGYAWYRYRTQGRDERKLVRGIRSAAGRLVQLVEELAATRPTLGKPLVTGMSQGGILTFALAVRYPEALGAAFPVAGWLPRALWPWRRAREGQPRIFAMHGSADRVVPAAPARRLIRHLERRGYSVHLLEYQGVAHEMNEPMHEQRYLALEERVGEMWLEAQTPLPSPPVLDVLGVMAGDAGVFGDAGMADAGVPAASLP